MFEGLFRKKEDNSTKEGGVKEEAPVISEPTPILEFHDLDTYTSEFKSDILTMEYILKCLKNKNPEFHFNPSDIELIQEGGTGKIPVGENGGWTRSFYYSATYKGKLILDCKIEARDGLSDNGVSSVHWTVKRK